MAEDDILRERGPLVTTPDLAEPRRLTWRDAIAAERRRLMNQPRGQPGPGLTATAAIGARQPTAPALADDTLIYHYTREHELTNDHLGYGEKLSDELWRFEAGGTSVKRVKRDSQRTKSGRQLLSQDTQAQKKP